MDWSEVKHNYEVVVYVVHQTDVNHTLGILSGVIPSGLSITENYYSDSRVQAKVTTVVKEGTSDGYVTSARLRIVLSIPGQNWAKELVTGYVSGISTSAEHGYVKRTYAIEGTIWGLLEHTTNAPITIAKGAYLIAAWTNLMSSQTKMQYSTSGAANHQFGSTVVYEAGEDLSTVLFELSSGYNRMDVDGHGVVTLKKYIAPVNKEPSTILDYRDSKSILIPPMSADDLSYESPGRSVVTTVIQKTDSKGKTTQQTLVGSYDAPATHATSIASRGYIKGIKNAYSGNSQTPSKSELNTVAKQRWTENQGKGIQWSLTSIFGDYHAGDVVTLVAPYGRSTVDYVHKVLISSVNTNLGEFRQELTVKEV